MAFFRNTRWEYRGEGNGNIVISLCNEGKIVRIIKRDRVDGDDLNSVGNAICPRQLVAFIKETVAPLVGTAFVHPGEVICLTKEDVRFLNEKLDYLRPEFRKHRILVEDDCLAISMPDYCSRHFLTTSFHRVKLVGPLWAIEIKPKMGFLRELPPSSEKTVSEIIKTTVCKYHLIQHRKLCEGKIQHISDYCPLDLFSGCRIRMLEALKSLLQNPQNNLRIFKNGLLVFGEHVDNSLIDATREMIADALPNGDAETRLCHILCEALLRDHPLQDEELPLPRKSKGPRQRCKYKDIFPSCEMNLSKENVDCMHLNNTCNLPNGCILNRVLAMQMMSLSDAESVLSTYNDYQHHLKGLSTDSIRHVLYDRQDVPESACLSHCEDFEQAAQQIRNYLLSCTASDCSIMVTLSLFDSEADSSPCSDWIIEDSARPNGQRYLHSIALVDTDWKPHTRIPKHASEDIELINQFLKLDSVVSDWARKFLDTRP